ncbi:MAG: glycoside hydrolase family 172 protein [Caldilineaceae bacterium]
MPTQGPATQISSLPVAVNPTRSLNCFWEMPFRQRARITIENRNPVRKAACFYQVNYCLTEVPEQAGYFHAQFRRRNPLPYKEEYVILDGVQGWGHYVARPRGWSINNNGWWGEGEIKFFIDGDGSFPPSVAPAPKTTSAVLTTSTGTANTTEYTTLYLGMHQVLRPDGAHQSQHRHAMYRWHVVDPIVFQQDLRATIQALGWRKEGRYYPGQHDICSVAYWYQTCRAAPFPTLGDRDYLEVV